MTAKECTEIYKHYGMNKDMEEIKSGNSAGVDFAIGKESDIKKLTADMAGFGTDKSQRVIIEYDKGYGFFIVKRIPMVYGGPEGTPQESDPP